MLLSSAYNYYYELHFGNDHGIMCMSYSQYRSPKLWQLSLGGGMIGIIFFSLPVQDLVCLMSQSWDNVANMHELLTA